MEPEEEIQDDLDDIPGLFNKSSLREKEDPDLPPLSKEVNLVQKSHDQNNHEYINEYRLEAEIGRGAFGSVYRVTSKLTNQQLAIKFYNIFILSKQRFFAADGEFATSFDMLENQLNIIKRLSHKNIALCFEILYSPDKIYMVNELGTFGQIMIWDELELKYKRNVKAVDYLQQKYKTQNLSDITRIVFIQVCEGIKYLHDHNITNRDIKVDNILCKETQELGNEIKIVDFTTVRYSGDDISFFPTGTPGFRGPQHQFASSEGYSCKLSDVWSIGISMYCFFHEIFPFFGESELEVDIKAKNQELLFDPHCDPLLKSVIQKMTKKDWKQRISVQQALTILKTQ